MIRKTRLVPILFTTLTILPLLLLAACGGSDAPEHSSATPEPIRARTLEIQPVQVPDAADHTASVEPIRRVEPGTKLLGRVDAVLVEEGERVGAGQVLARLEKRDLEAAFRQAEAAVRMAEARLENARAQHERFVDLHQRGSVTDKNLEDAVAGLRVAEAAVDQAQADVHAAEVMLSYAEVRSPFAGWVTAKYAEEGDMSRPGMPLFVVEDLSRVKVEVDVPSGAVAGLRVGGPARVEVAGELRPATIHRIVPAADAGSRTFTVQVLFDAAAATDDPEGLKSGLFARVRLGTGVRQLLVLPEAAVVSRGQLRGAFVVDDAGTARLRWLRLGEIVAGEDASTTGREILSGLEAGELVILAPPPGLAEGTPVTPLAGSPAADQEE